MAVPHILTWAYLVELYHLTAHIWRWETCMIRTGQGHREPFKKEVEIDLWESCVLNRCWVCMRVALTSQLMKQRTEQLLLEFVPHLVGWNLTCACLMQNLDLLQATMVLIPNSTKTQVWAPLTAFLLRDFSLTSYTEVQSMFITSAAWW